MAEKSSRRKFISAAVVSGMAAGLLPLSLAAKTERDTEDVPANEKNNIFLFQGDSITDGNRGRTLDPNHVMGHGYAFAVASRVGADFPTAGFSFYNRGVSGNKMPDLQARWQADTLDLKPTVLSILIGVNDAGAVIDKKPAAQTAEEFETGYRQLLTASKVLNANMLFVLCLPFIYPVGKRKDNIEDWRAAVGPRADVVKKLAREFNAVLVDFPAVFDKAIEKAPAEYWVWDGVHPTVFGHELMAREWIKQVSGRLKFLKKYDKGKN